MKKILFSLAMPCMALVAFAQIDKGNTLLGGNLGFNFQQTNNPTGNGFTINFQPYIQFAYKANRTIGFGLDFSYQSNSINDGNNKLRQSGLTPSISFTQFHPVKGKFGWWLQEKIGAGFYNVKNIDNGNEVKNSSTSVSANIIPGVYYVPDDKKKWLLHASVGGLGGSYSNSYNSESWGAYTNLFQYYQFGFAYIFRKG